MSAANYDFTLDQGSDFAVLLQISEDGIAKDLTGYSARAQMRKSKNPSESISATFTVIVTDAATGSISMSLPHADSSPVEAGVYNYDMEIFTVGDAAVTRMLQGTVTVTQEVTR